MVYLILINKKDLRPNEWLKIGNQVKGLENLIKKYGL